MNESATRADIDEVVGIIRDFMQQVDSRFNTVEQQLNTFDYKFSTIEKEIIDLKDSHNRLLNTIDGFIGRIDKYETELAARDSQFEKLLA